MAEFHEEGNRWREAASDMEKIWKTKRRSAESGLMFSRKNGYGRSWTGRYGKNGEHSHRKCMMMCKSKRPRRRRSSVNNIRIEAWRRNGPQVSEKKGDWKRP